MTVTMKANRIHVFGGPEVILFEDVPRPTPGRGEVLVRVHAAGVGPWDAWVRAGRSAVRRLDHGDVLSWCTNRCATFCAPSTGIQWETSGHKRPKS
jgi:D-arabinose 1-dehydrogenase-like Zn-dependent alcohol dehydrogenase